MDKGEFKKAMEKYKKYSKGVMIGLIIAAVGQLMVFAGYLGQILFGG